MTVTNFQTSFNNGILSKTSFINSEITNGLVQWLSQYVKGEKNLKEFKLPYRNFLDAKNNYQWPPKGEVFNFENTRDKFIIWRQELENKNQDQLLNTCNNILKWGKVLKNERIGRIKNLRFFLDHMNKKLSENEILINDLNPNFISSGFTKIYAALNENYIMYDGRVGASLCYLIRHYLETINENQIPSELIFGWGKGMGGKNRDPNNRKVTTIVFEEITANRELHFISQIKANWLLKLLADHVELIDIPENEKAFSLQTALFVLGEDLPKN